MLDTSIIIYEAPCPHCHRIARWEGTRNATMEVYHGRRDQLVVVCECMRRIPQRVF